MFSRIQHSCWKAFHSLWIARTCAVFLLHRSEGTVITLFVCLPSPLALICIDLEIIFSHLFVLQLLNTIHSCDFSRFCAALSLTPSSVLHLVTVSALSQIKHVNYMRNGNEK